MIDLSRTFDVLVVGGGKALVNAYFETAHKLGVEVMYDSEVSDLTIKDGRFSSAIVVQNGASHEVWAKTVVVAAGGFEANIEWLKEGWGEIADGLAVLEDDPPTRCRVEHPSGGIEVALDLVRDGDQLDVRSAGVVRTTRKLFAGHVFVPASVWDGPCRTKSAEV